MMFRRFFVGLSLVFAVALAFDAARERIPVGLWLIGGALVGLGIRDLSQRRHALLRNYPVIGHLRFFAESVRPELRQYFGESDTDGVPFNREVRSLVYRRAKGEPDTVPFGTKRSLMEGGVEWIPHSMYPREPRTVESRVIIGAETSSAPYSCSRLNVAAMSFGALSGPAIRALSEGACRGKFALNSGEGGVSSYHLDGKADLIWQIGTGYFGCRDRRGRFDLDRYAKIAATDRIKMIELKLSQGGKPGYGGVLPASKVSEEIAKIRGVRVGQRVVSPPSHPGIDSAEQLLAFVEKLRRLSGNKPVGIKLCVGAKHDIVDLGLAMLQTGTTVDYIVVDGAEAGTGAAPLEFANHVGTPLEQGLVTVVDTLCRFGLRERVRVFASGRILTGFDLFRAIALGADGCFAGRGMMLALGCLQALRCNSNDCPVGIATQRPELAAALDVSDKAQRVQRYHAATIDSFHALLAAAGARHPAELGRGHIVRRLSGTRVASLAEIHPPSGPGDDLVAQHTVAVRPREHRPAEMNGDWLRLAPAEHAKVGVNDKPTKSGRRPLQVGS